MITPAQLLLLSGASPDAYAVAGYRPKLVADFGEEYYRKAGAGTTFSGLITHARASDATMVNSSGSLVTVGSGVPRVGHHVWNGSAWVNAGLRHESEARTNLFDYSDSASGYTASQATITNPGAYFKAVSDNSLEGSVLLDGTSPPAVAAPVGLTLEAKAAENSDVGLELREGATFRRAFFDLTDGSTNNISAGLTTFVEPMADGWYRISVFGPGCDTRLRFLPQGFGAVGDGSSGALFRRWQLEEGAEPSSYIPTDGSTATRAAETLTIPAANLPYSATAMSIQMKGRMTYADTSSLVQAYYLRWYASGANNIEWRLNTNGAKAGNPYFVQEIGSVSDSVGFGSDDDYSAGVLVPFNLAARHGSTFINGAVDGTAYTANETPVALPDLSGTDFELGYDFMGTIQQFRMWDADLADAGIEEATT